MPRSSFLKVRFDDDVKRPKGMLWKNSGSGSFEGSIKCSKAFRGFDKELLWCMDECLDT